MTVYILWLMIHTIEQDNLIYIYRNKEDCIKELQFLQSKVSTDILEYHMQEFKVE